MESFLHAFIKASRFKLTFAIRNAEVDADDPEAPE